MKIDEALYQLKQNIKMHEIEGTTSNQNEREKALLDYITNLQEKLQQKENIIKEIREYIENNSYFKDNLVKTMIFKDYSNGILEILDKENNNETI